MLILKGENMKRSNLVTLFALVILLSPFCNAYEAQCSQIMNGGFEDGFVGWAVNHPNTASALYSYVTPNLYTYSSVEGSALAALISPTRNPATGTLPFWPPTITLSQTFSLDAGATLSGYSAFFTSVSSTQWNDSAWVWVSGPNVADTLWSIDVSSVWGTGKQSPWTYWSWVAPTDGQYTLTLNIRSGDVSDYHSFALFDGITTTSVSTVPDPGTFWLLSSGLIGLVGLRRKFRMGK